MIKTKVAKSLILGVLIVVLVLQVYTYLRPEVFQFKMGYIDKMGQFVIKPQFNTARPFSEGLAAVSPAPLTLAYIDKTGKTVIQPVKKDFYVPDEHILPHYSFCEHFKSVCRNGKMGFIDREGNIVIEPSFERVDVFSEGLAAIKVEDKWGYVDSEGVVVIEPEFKHACPFSEGLACVRVDEKEGFIDKGGEFIIPPRFDAAYSFSEGLALIRIGDKSGFIDRTGRYAIDPQYDNFQGTFCHGLAMVAVENRWCFIDKQGSVVIDAFSYGYELLWTLATNSMFSEGLSVVKLKDGKYAYIERTGLIAFDKTFDFAQPFSEGLAAVEVNGKWGYIDKAGKFVIEPAFGLADSFAEGLASVGLWIKN